MRIAWATDLHLNFVSAAGTQQFLAEVERDCPDVLLVGGDVGEAHDFAAHLERFADEMGTPVYFVLGNHDYYKGSIAGARRTARALGQQSELLHWLPDAGVVRLTDKTALVGHGGWGDARAADFLQSDVVLNDYLLIEELRSTHGGVNPSTTEILSPKLRDKLQSLGDEAAAHFRRVLPEALEWCERVLVLMHVPPFREACWHDGRLSDDNWAPHFSCVAAGEALLEVMRQHPRQRMTVLCGHTHGAGYVAIRENLEVFTGGAVYGHPKLQQTLDVE